MDLSDDQMLTLLATVAGCGTWWIITLHGRQSGHEASCAEVRKNADERYTMILKLLSDLDSKIDRIMESNHDDSHPHHP